MKEVKGMGKRFTNDEFLERANPENLPYEILSEYTGNRNRVKVRCKKPECKCEWEPLGASILDNSTSCPVCRAKASSERQAQKNRVGETKIANDGSLMQIVEYVNANDLTVEFQDEFKFKVHTAYNNFKRGNVSNPGIRIKYDRGYVGQGAYYPTFNKRSTKAYDAWTRMFDRCYSDKYHKKFPTYIGCEVCEEWWNFQNFAKWFYDNYYEINNTSMEVDKDWYVVENKIYCPENCCIAPSIINTCLLTHDKIKNFDMPIGVSWHKNGSYVVACSTYGKKKTIGYYHNVEEAEQAYWKFKINYVEQLAEDYKEYIPNRLYNAMKDFKNTYKQRYKLEKDGLLYVC